MEIKKINIFNSLIIKMLERVATYGVAFIINVILARILFPEDYSVLAIVTVLINFANTFVKGGFSRAIIQKKEIDDKDISSVFYTSLFIAVIFYTAIYLLAPYISDYYEYGNISSAIRLMALVLFPAAYYSIQDAMISRLQMFKQQLISSFISCIVSGSIGIILAYRGYGVFSLVIQQLLNQIFQCITITLFLKWYPKLVYSYGRTKILWSFGWKLLVANILENILQDIISLTIGKKYDANQLGYYNRANQFPNLIAKNISAPINTVILPAFSYEQHNMERIKELISNSMKVISYMTYPMFFGLIIIARPLVVVLLTEKWLPAVIFIQVLSIYYLNWPTSSVILQAYNSIGRSDIYLKLQIARKIVEFSFLGTALILFDTPLAIASFSAIASLINMVINVLPANKYFGYKVKDLFVDISPALMLSLISCTSAYTVSYLNLSSGVTLLLEIVVAIIIYIKLSLITKNTTFIYLINKLKLFSINAKPGNKRSK